MQSYANKKLFKFQISKIDTPIVYSRQEQATYVSASSIFSLCLSNISCIAASGGSIILTSKEVSVLSFFMIKLSAT